MASLSIYRKISALTMRQKKLTRDAVKKCAGHSYVRGSSEIAYLHTRRGKRRERHPADAEVLHLRSEGVRSCTPVRSNPDAVVSWFEDSKQRYDGGNLKVRRRISRYAGVLALWICPSMYILLVQKSYQEFLSIFSMCGCVIVIVFHNFLPGL